MRRVRAMTSLLIAMLPALRMAKGGEELPENIQGPKTVYTHLHLLQVEDGLDAGGRAGRGQLLGEVGQLEQGGVTVPGRLAGHLRHLHRRQRWVQPPAAADHVHRRLPNMLTVSQHRHRVG